MRWHRRRFASTTSSCGGDQPQKMDPTHMAPAPMKDDAMMMKDGKKAASQTSYYSDEDEDEAADAKQPAAPPPRGPHTAITQHGDMDCSGPAGRSCSDGPVQAQRAAVRGCVRCVVTASASHQHRVPDEAQGQRAGQPNALLPPHRQTPVILRGERRQVHLQRAAVRDAALLQVVIRAARTSRASRM